MGLGSSQGGRNLGQYHSLPQAFHGPQHAEGMACHATSRLYPAVPSFRSPSPAQGHLSISGSVPMPPVRPRHPPGFFPRPLSKTHPHSLASQVLAVRNALPPFLEGTRELVRSLEAR